MEQEVSVCNLSSESEVLSGKLRTSKGSVVDFYRTFLSNHLLSCSSLATIIFIEF